MAAYETNLTGVLFVNDKSGNDKRPDWKGSVEIDGEQFWVSGWSRSSAKGDLISLKLERKENQAPKTSAAPAPTAAAASFDADEEIPF